MKRSLLTICMALVCSGLLADEKSDALLRKLSATLKEYSHYEVRFTARSEGQMPEMEGYYIVSGEKYYIRVEDREVYCDGKFRYEVDGDNMEVVIDRFDHKDKNVLSNPPGAFDFLDGTFSGSYKGMARYAGRSCERIMLSPLDKGMAIDDIMLWLDSSNGLPAGLEYRIDGFDAPVEVVVDSFKPVSKPDPSTFSFDRKKYRDYEIIDFR